MLDGAARLTDLFAEAQRLGMPALAMTDHGNLYGAYDFYKRATAAGIKPVIGVEAYITPGTSRFDRTRVRWAEGGENDVSGGGAYTHLTMLAADADGLHNLFRLGSYASLEGYFYKPRADRELLERYAKGLLATTGCPSGEIQTWLRIGDFERACQAAGEFRDIFGPDNFYLELIDNGLEIERKVRDDLLRLGKRLDLRPVVTNDLHYTFAGDADAHAVLLCVQSGSTLADPKRFKFDTRDLYLKSPQEMRALWDTQVPGACDTTLEIADRIGDYGSVFAARDLMPRFPVPAGETEDSWLRAEAMRGLERRFGRHEVPESHRKQVDYELDVICRMGFPGYFLVVADLVGYAKREGIRVGPGRGSAAGAMVAWALGITELDPLQHGLIFERFLNPDRVSMPDFDIDFDERRRGEVIRYVTNKYGDDRVSQIVTYGTIKAKQAVKDASRVLGYPFGIGEKITKAMPPSVLGKDVPLAKLFDRDDQRYAEGAEFRALYEVDPDVKTVVDTARDLEGLKRQWGVHAAGVIMSSAPLIDIIPIMRREQDGAIITQFDYPTCESLGLMKMDFLGLRNLTVLDDAVANIALNRGFKLVLEDLSLDDAPTYALLGRGETLGVFQLDGGPMRSLLRLMRPDNFEDISAVLALYRPGPMGADSHTNYALRKNRRQEITPIHPELAEPLAEILGTTHGLIVYQEQVMAIAQKVAGFTLSQADNMRRAMGKKKKKILDAEFVPFSEGMQSNGYSYAAIKALWDTLVPFSDYAFNKAHTAAYGMVSYWTAYLKANFPAEFLAALLTSVADDKDKMALYLNECRRMGIQVLPPDVNESAANFTPVGTDIRFGLTAVRNVGHNVVDGIVAAREANGKAVNFHGFLDQVPLVVCNKRVIESLIKAGAFESMGHSRRALMSIYEAAVDAVLDLKRNEANGQDDLFGELTETDPVLTGSVPDLPDWDKRTKLAFEREMLGLYVSDHPLQGLEHILAAERDIGIGELIAEDGPRESTVTIAGMITNITRKTTRRGDIWAVITVEDLQASIEVLLFPRAYEMVSTVLATDTVVKIKGKVKVEDDVVSLNASELSLPDITQAPSGPVVISLPANRCTPEVVQQLRDVLAAHPGLTEVRLRLRSAGKTTVMKLDDRLRVTPSQPLMADLKALLGPSCLVS